MFKRELLERFKDKRILVIGDFMLDEYVEGKVERISPEAPVPVVDAKETKARPGGAANVVANILSLGAKATALGVIGNDKEGEILKTLLKDLGADIGGLFVEPSRPTTRKTRIIAGSQQLLRIDWECREEIPKKVKEEIKNFLLSSFSSYDGIIISDYGKGVITKEFFEITKLIKEKVPLILDPKEKNFPIYKDITSMTPNVKETYQDVGILVETDKDAERAGRLLIKKHSLDFAVITRSEKGISIITKEGAKHIPTRAKQVYDVTGAGDTVISVFTLALVSGAPPFVAAEVANLAAGIVVGKVGTATTTVEEIWEASRVAL
ncbi:D-glycero-beta-D-manno-heptose-7-phosphate kinase [Thermovibrio sp.]